MTLTTQVMERVVVSVTNIVLYTVTQTRSCPPPIGPGAEVRR